MSETRDMLLSGRVTLFQPKKGFRAGTDSLLLAAALEAGAGARALEVGCGAGGALFPAAWRLPDATFTGLEQSGQMAELARRAVLENRFEGRVEIVEGDAGEMPIDWENRFDLVFSNPPFFGEGTIKQPGEGKRDAYIEGLPLKGWVDAMLFALRPKGTFVMIHRAAEMARILALIERRSGEITVIPVRPYPGAEAKRVIIKARKGLRSGPMRLLGGIDLFDCKGGAVSARMTAISEEGAGLDWS